MQQKTETKRSTHSLHTNNTMKPTLMVDKHFQNTHGNSDTWISKSILNTHTKRTRIDGSIQTRPRPRRRPAVDAAVRDQGNGNSIRCSQSWRRRERWMRCLPTFPRDAPGWYTRSRVVRNFVMDIHACARATDGVDPSIRSFIRFATDDRLTRFDFSVFFPAQTSSGFTRSATRIRKTCACTGTQMGRGRYSYPRRRFRRSFRNRRSGSISPGMACRCV